MSERTPLLHYRLSTSVNESGEHGENRPGPTGEHAAQPSPPEPRRKAARDQPQKLSTFFGVIIPTLLSMFSVVLFLRIGESCRLCVSVCVSVCVYLSERKRE